MPVVSDDELKELRRGPGIEAALVGPFRLPVGKTRVVQFTGANSFGFTQVLVRNASNRICFVSVATVPGSPFVTATFSSSDTPSRGSDPENDFAFTPRFAAIVYPSESLVVMVSGATRLAVTEVWF